MASTAPPPHPSPTTAARSGSAAGPVLGAGSVKHSRRFALLRPRLCAALVTPPCSTAALWQNQRVGRYGVAGGVDGCGEDPSEQQRGHAWHGSAPTVKRSNAGRTSQAAPMSRWSRARQRTGPPVGRAGEQEGRSRARRAAPWPAVSTSAPRAAEAPARRSVGRSARPRAADVQARPSVGRLARGRRKRQRAAGEPTN